MLGLRAAPGHLCRPPPPPAPRAVNLTSERALGTPAGAGGWVAPGGDSGDSGGHTHGHTEAGAGGGRTPALPPPSPLAMCPGNQRATSRPPRGKLSRQAAPAAPHSAREASLMAPCARAQRDAGGPVPRRTAPPRPRPDPAVPALRKAARRLARARYAAFGDARGSGGGLGAGLRDYRGPARSRDFAGVLNLWGGFF